MPEIYDLIIIGAGPAGLTAGIYACRYRVKNLIIGSLVGGLASEAHRVCNFPSESNIKGLELTEKIKEHALELKAEIKQDKVVSLTKKDTLFTTKTEAGENFLSKTLLLAIGAKRCKLDLPNESKFLGRGISYCATCDGPFYKNKVVAVIGGSDAAVTAALYLSEIAKKVFLIYRKSRLRAEPVWIEELKTKRNIEVVFNSNVVKLQGNNFLEKIELDNPYQGKNPLSIDGVFVEIGCIPDKTLSKQLNVDLDENGYIKIDQAGKTNIEGVWAAGDITTGSNGFRQIITACSEGAIAAQSIYEYLQKL